MFRILIGALLGLVSAGMAMTSTSHCAVSGFHSGNKLYEWCKDGGNRAACVAYVLGVYDGMEVDHETGHFVLQGTPVICFPKGEYLTGGQLADIALKYIKDNPQLRHKNGALLVKIAFTEAFPCR